MPSMTHMEKIRTDSDLCNYTVNEEMLEKEGIINRTSPASEKKTKRRITHKKIEDSIRHVPIHIWLSIISTYTGVNIA